MVLTLQASWMRQFPTSNVRGYEEGHCKKTHNCFLIHATAVMSATTVANALGPASLASPGWAENSTHLKRRRLSRMYLVSGPA
jgi:hypothetical protein